MADEENGSLFNNTVNELTDEQYVISSSYDEYQELAQQRFDNRPKYSNAEYQKLYEGALNSIYKSMGAGAFTNTLQLFLTQHDRFGSNIIPANNEYSGATFITRPRLNLTTTSLRQDRILSLLDQNDVDTIKFAIRCCLDSKLSTEYMEKNGGVYSQLFNHKSPWNIPLCNALVGISGFPEINLDTETTEGGYHSEDFTFVKGGDDLNKTYDLQLSFKDITGGPIMTMLHMWVRYMQLQAKGLVVAYIDDIEERRLNYTVSIYRFVLDPARQTIMKWCKATGCFPVNVPLGACFDINPGEHFVSSVGKFSIPFKCNKIEYNDYAIFKDFNILTERYNPQIQQLKLVTTSPYEAANYNFIGQPYIITDEHGPHLSYYYDESDDIDFFGESLEEFKQNNGVEDSSGVQYLPTT